MREGGRDSRKCNCTDRLTAAENCRLNNYLQSMNVVETEEKKQITVTRKKDKSNVSIRKIKGLLACPGCDLRAVQSERERSVWVSAPNPFSRCMAFTIPRLPLPPSNSDIFIRVPLLEIAR